MVSCALTEPMVHLRGIFLMLSYTTLFFIFIECNLSMNVRLGKVNLLTYSLRLLSVS